MRYTDDNVVNEAVMFLRNNRSIAQTSKILGIPHSTLHWHLTHRLPKIDPTLHRLTSLMLQAHKERRWRHA